MEDNDRIRRRAHEIWEGEGRPEGRDAMHWAQAEAELGGTGDQEEAGVTLGDSPADGRIIAAGEGGTAGGPDEAEEALATGIPDAREGR